MSPTSLPRESWRPNGPTRLIDLLSDSGQVHYHWSCQNNRTCPTSSPREDQLSPYEFQRTRSPARCYLPPQFQSPHRVRTARIEFRRRAQNMCCEVSTVGLICCWMADRLRVDWNRL